MKKIFIGLFALFSLWGCKKDAGNNGSVTLQVQGETPQNLAMSTMQTSIVYPTFGGNPFCDSCSLIPGSQTYVIITDYKSSGNGSIEENCVLDIKMFGVYSIKWQDSSINKIFYSNLSVDSFHCQDTSSSLLNLGADLSYTDVAGVIWDSKTGSNNNGNLIITSRSPLANIPSNSGGIYTVISGTFSCNVYNNSGNSKSVAGSFSNIGVRTTY